MVKKWLPHDFNLNTKVTKEQALPDNVIIAYKDDMSSRFAPAHQCENYRALQSIGSGCKLETPILERNDFINNTEITANTAYEPFHTYSDLLTVDELQDALSIGRNAAYRLIHDGEIKSLRIGRTIKVPKRYLLDFVYGSCYNSNVTSNGLTVLKEATV